MPEMSDRIKYSLLEAINKAVDGGINRIRTEVGEIINEKLESAERRCELKTMSDVEFVESFNRPDIISIVGVNEDRSSDNKISESYSQSIPKVFQLGQTAQANVTWQDISIGHRLPKSNQNKQCPINVKLSGCRAKIEMLQKKKHLWTG